MYEAVRAWPDGESTVSRFAETAGRYGYDGVVVRSRSDARPTFDAGTNSSDDFVAHQNSERSGGDAGTNSSGIDVVDGIEIEADGPSQASGHVGNFRPKCTLLLVRGGSPEMNRFAVENERVDVLTRPMADRGDFNHVLAKAAAENGVRVEFNLSRVLGSDGGPRVQALSDLRKLREIVTYYDAPYVVSADPASHLQLRAPRELLAVGESIGFEREAVERGLDEWGRLAERNRQRGSDAFIGPGVKRGKYEEEH